MDKLVEQLKKMKGIGPDSFYSRNSRNLILKSRRSDSSTFFSFINETIKFSTAMALTILLIVVVGGGLSYLQKSPLLLKMAGLDLKTLKVEAEEMNIDIKLAKLEYYDENSKNIGSALKETTEDSPAQFHSIILEKEFKKLDLEQSEENNIDKALNELTK